MNKRCFVAIKLYMEKVYDGLIWQFMRGNLCGNAFLIFVSQTNGLIGLWNVS